MNIDKTIKNWKWWLMLLPALTILTIVGIPKAVIMVLEVIIHIVGLFDIGNRRSKFAKKLADWVQK